MRESRPLFVGAESKPRKKPYTMSDALVSPGSPSSPIAFPAQMAALRRGQGLSLRQLARSAGLSHDSLGAWERGERFPRLPELEAALTALGVSPGERGRLIALVPAARAVRHACAAHTDVWAEAAGPLPGGGTCCERCGAVGG